MSQTVVLTSNVKKRELDEKNTCVFQATQRPKYDSREDDARMYEYTSAANPQMAEVPVLVHPPELHQTGKLIILFLCCVTIFLNDFS